MFHKLLRRMCIQLSLCSVFYKFLLGLFGRNLNSVLHPASLPGTKSVNYTSDVGVGESGDNGLLLSEEHFHSKS